MRQDLTGAVSSVCLVNRNKSFVVIGTSMKVIFPSLRGKLLISSCVDSFKLGSRGDRHILLFPGDTMSSMESRPLQWDLWVFRICPVQTLFLCRTVLLFCNFSFPQSFVNVPRIWKPAFLCRDCSHTNNAGCNFCQHCGFQPAPPLVTLWFIPQFRNTLYQSPRYKLKQEFPVTKLCHFSLTSLLSCAPTYITECSFHPYPHWKGTS